MAATIGFFKQIVEVPGNHAHSV